MISQAELTYDTNGNYSGACADPTLASMLTSIGTESAASSCFSYDGSRWGVTAKLNQTAFQAYSVDSSGIVTWDTVDQPSLAWAAANTACQNEGAHLPTLEQLYSLYVAYNTRPTPGFLGTDYWSNVTVPSNNTYAFTVNMNIGSIGNLTKFNPEMVRCVY